MLNMLAFDDDKNLPEIIFAPSNTANLKDVPMISASLREFLIQRRERGYKWYEKHDMKSLGKLPSLTTAVATQNRSNEQETRDMLWTTVSEVFFSSTKERNRKYSRDNDDAKSFLIPSRHYLESKNVAFQSKKATKPKRQSKNEAVSEMIAGLKGMDMTDGEKKIEELITVKNKTELALQRMKEKDKDMECIKRKQQFYTENLVANKLAKQRRLRDEKRLRKDNHTFVLSFATDDAKRKADAVVCKQRHKALWNKAYKAALKSRLDL